MEANQHLSKYALKQLRLAQEEDFGIDYTEQIEQSQKKAENHEVNACADRANKLDAIEEFKLKIKRIAQELKIDTEVN